MPRVMAIDSASSALYRLTPFEVAVGFVFGYTRTPRHAEKVGKPIAVLEDELVAALTHEPCVVAFSGGRDSSALLALAVDLARRHGLEMPIPVSVRYVSHPCSHESDWQERVVRHLGIDEWVRVDLDDECDLLGPLATDLLRRHGLLWPPAVHMIFPWLEIARGGALVTGEGGDEVFGMRRSTPLRHLFSDARRRRAALTSVRESIGPRSVRRRHLARLLTPEADLEWLTAEARQELLRRKVQLSLDEPLSWRASTVNLAHRRSYVHGSATMRHLARTYDVRLHEPLLSVRFLCSLATHGPVLGPVTRSAAMRRLFGHLLPDDVIRRRSKATFNSVLFGPMSRRFAASWRGRCVVTDLIDQEGLAKAWNTETPHAGTFALLQAAWLAEHADDRTRMFDGR